MVRTARCLLVDLGDEPGAFSAVSSTLGDADVNIEGFSAQAGEEGGLAYVVPEDVERGRQALEDAGLDVGTRPFVAASLTSRPGELARAMARLVDSGIRPDAAFLVLAPWGPQLQVAFACGEPGSAAKVLEELEAER